MTYRRFATGLILRARAGLVFKGLKIEPLIIIGAAILGVVKLFWSIRNARVTPDPWTEEIERSVHQPEAVSLCHRCFIPQSNKDWFCPNCGTAVGTYNNLMPYVYLFSQGEVLRAGTTDRIRPGFITIVGYLLVSLQGYVFFAPIFWYFLVKNFRRKTAVADHNQPNDDHTSLQL